MEVFLLPKKAAEFQKVQDGQGVVRSWQWAMGFSPLQMNLKVCMYNVYIYIYTHTNRIHQKCCGSSSFFSHYHNHSCTDSSCQLPTCALKQTCQALSRLAPLRPVLEVPSTMLWTPQSYNDLTCSSVVLDLILMSFQHAKDATKSTERNTRKENSGTFSHLSFF